MIAATTYRVEVDRALPILNALAENGSELGLADLSAKLRLMILEHHRYVEKDSPSMKYELGWKLLELGSQAVARRDVSSLRCRLWSGSSRKPARRPTSAYCGEERSSRW